ncbi:flagellar filament capping protein FliD [Rahnella ecdela]|jgi:flagellar hook-associated protein 2|uniref:Flagellar hook-associated protein 2 n=1 Tax=Rahnella ecdela TaxID=2816250 RepID=A0ABS6LKQ7_9GAMM|nr:flagellar filament capping protein FliD [Rahnella ecdela]MBU9847422.1 flagellar filament capping protein FliD [Rahnella ecdela]
MATISSLGIGSGLDLTTLLDNLTTAEKARLTPISTAQSSYSAKLTAYGTLQSSLQSFADATSALNSASVYQATTATSNNTSAFTATTAAGVAAGKYAINVTQLAQAQVLVSGTAKDTSTALGGTTSTGTRSLTITKGDGTPVSISLTDDQTSLAGMRDAINGADAGVTASVLKVSDGSYQLIVSSDDTGTDSQMTLSVTGDDTLNSFIGYDSSTNTGGMTQNVEAKNAQLSVNGIAIERQSNEVTDAPEGITLNLLATTDSAATLTVKKDTSDASTKIQAFVTAYNALQSTFTSLTKFTAVDNNADTQDTSNGALLGDSALRTIQTQLKSAISSAFNSNGISSLSSLGITTDPSTGNLKVDTTKLDDVLSNSTSDVKTMLLGDGSTTGVITKLNNLNVSFLDTDSGTIANAKTAVNTTLKSLTTQYNAVNDSITATIARYKTQFTALDVTMASLNSTSTYLTQQFATTSTSSSLGQ